MQKVGDTIEGGLKCIMKAREGMDYQDLPLVEDLLDALSIAHEHLQR